MLEYQLAVALRPFLTAFHEDPGHSDLDSEQPIHITVQLGDLRRARWTMSNYGEKLRKS